MNKLLTFFLLINIFSFVYSKNEDQRSGYSPQALENYVLGLKFFDQKDFKTAAKYFQNASEEKFKPAVYYLGLSYYNDTSVKNNYKIALKQWKKIPSNADACFAIGVLYENGQGVKKNIKTALTWLQKSCDLNSPKAQYYIGSLYAKGEKVKKDYKKAIDYFLLASNQKHPVAIYNIGCYYSQGFGVEKNFKKSLEFYKKAIALKFPPAIYAIAYMYYNGDGVDKDKKYAIQLFEYSASEGFFDAVYRLAIIYDSVDLNNKIESLKWYLIYSYIYPEKVLNEINELYSKLSKEEISQATVNSKLWLTKYLNNYRNFTNKYCNYIMSE